MKRRMLDAALWIDSNFTQLGPWARLLQLGLINLADDQGRFLARPAYLRSQLFVDDSEISDDDIRHWLGEIGAGAAILLYEVNGKPYGQWLNWWQMQSLQYAAPSQYPRPDGWQDRIRYNAKGGVVLTSHWVTGKGERLPDSCDQNGAPLPIAVILPQKKQDPAVPRQASQERAQEPAVASPGFPSENLPRLPAGNPPEFRPGLPAGLPAEEPPDFPPGLPAGGPNKEQINTKKGGERACVSEPPEPLSSPPFFAHPREPTAGEQSPGVRCPTQEQEQRQADRFSIQAARHGVAAEPLRRMVELVLEATGKASLAKISGERGRQALTQAQETVISLLEMKRRTPEQVQAILSSWRKHDWRGKSAPTFSQIVEHASAMDAGTHISVGRSQAPQEEDRKLAKRAANAQTLLDAARRNGWAVDPQWQKDIDAAKGLGLM